MFSLRILFLALLLSVPVLAGADNSAGASNSADGAKAVEVRKIIGRTFGTVPANVRFSLVGKTVETDSYSISVSDDILSVEGTSTVALARGFYDYVLENGYGISSWTGDRLDFPKHLPDLARREVVSPFRYRLYYNVCTFGYTTPFWKWEDWEHEIDWMALHGFDLPLAPIASEAISARVWKKLGLSQEEIDEFFTGPAHFPWMRMGNMTNVDGGMSREWHEAQISLQHKICDRLAELGMTPLFQGFAGFVPKALAEHYPGTELITTKWSGHRSYMLSPTDSLFSLISTEYIKEWEKEFGKGKYYLVDSFNELDIPFGKQGTQERFDKMHTYSSTIYNSIAAANPDAVWVLQGWMFGYNRNLWDPDSVRGLLSGAPDDRMMIIDLAVDYNEFVWRSENSWDYLDGFFGKEWTWSTVPNFGGRTALKGHLDFYLNGHLEALQSSNKGNLAGYGTSPEGIENNEILYELISAAGWSSQPIDTDSFLKNYTEARYGGICPQILSFWKEMGQSAYGNFTNNARFLWQQRPAYHRAETMNINSHYFTAIESFLSAPGRFRKNPQYRSDAIMYAALYLAAKGDYLLKKSNWALVAGDRQTAILRQSELVELLGDLDRLLESHPVLRMERWMQMARGNATCQEEESAFLKEAKRLVSTWSGPSLHDYSARVWSGLIRDYYIPRLENYFAAANEGVYVDLAASDVLFHECGNLELSEAEEFADPVKAARELVRKYSSIGYVPGKEYVPINEIGFWCVQDFAGRKTKRLYMSMLGDDFATMDGLSFTHTSGTARLTKIEFRTGHTQIATLNVDEPLSKGSFTVPFKGPGSNVGLEREVAVYLTFESGPDGSGMISFY